MLFYNSFLFFLLYSKLKLLSSKQLKYIKIYFYYYFIHYAILYVKYLFIIINVYHYSFLFIPALKFENFYCSRWLNKVRTEIIVSETEMLRHD